MNGEEIVLSKESKGLLFCFLGCECPVARFYAPRIESIAQEYQKQGIQVIGIMSLLQDSPEDIKQFAKERELTFPLVHDVDQFWASHFSATRIPEVVLLDSLGSMVYRGRVDDQMSPGIKKSQAASNDLMVAIKSLLTAEPIEVSKTQPVGCLITYGQDSHGKDKVTLADASSPTLTRDVMPIFYKQCFDCHREGDIGPFDISKTEEVQGWADMILEVVENGRMPPWHASPDHGSFKNERKVTSEEIRTIKSWVQAGAPIGDPKDLAVKPEVRTGWQLPREPDLVIGMRDRAFPVPASGTVEYQYFVVDPKIDEDRWVSAAQVIPGNASVVHHAIVFIRPPDGEPIKGISWLTSFVPGQRAVEYPHGYARRLPAGSKLVFQMHYTPVGKDQTDLTKVGLVFLEPDQITHEVSTIAGIDQSFEIPPHTNDYRVKGRIALPGGDSKLLIAAPHMHLRGKSFQMTAKFHDGHEQILLDVPRYDFNWQHAYEFREPIEASSINSLSFATSYDNSEDNPFNPNPSDYVMWGDQTWEEMAVVFLDVATAMKSTESTAKQSESTKEEVPRAVAQKISPRPPLDRSIRFAKDFLSRFDKNGDGKVHRSEVTQLILRYSFNRIDANNDGNATEEELIAAAEARRGQ